MMLMMLLTSFDEIMLSVPVVCFCKVLADNVYCVCKHAYVFDRYDEKKRKEKRKTVQI